MHDKSTEWNANAASYEAQARLAIERAKQAASDEFRSEYFRLATAWQKLADEIRGLITAVHSGGGESLVQRTAS